MTPKEFTSRLDEKRIVAAIAEAEKRTSGEIRVFISSKVVEDALTHARRRFEKLGMTRTRERNGVLLYFAPQSQKFAICGDIGIDQKCGPGFWEEEAAEIRVRLRAGDFTDAIIHAIDKVASLLAQHFPRLGDDRNELSNEITTE